MVNYRKLYTTRLASLASIFLACAVEVAGIADAQGFPARNLAEAEGAVGKLSGDMAIGRFDLDQAELLDYIRHVIPKHPRLPTLQNQACRGIRAYHSTMETDDPMIGGILHAIALCAYLEGDLKKAVQLLEAARRSEDAYLSVASADEFAARVEYRDFHVLELGRMQWMLGEEAYARKTILELQTKYARGLGPERHMRQHIVLYLAYLAQPQLLRDYLEAMTTKEALAHCDQFLGDDDFDYLVLNPPVANASPGLAEAMRERYRSNKHRCKINFVE